MEGLFIPKDILKIEKLSSTEKMVLALYKYYTEKGKYKCCSMTNDQIADDICISTRQLMYIKKHLKELGYIRTDGGVKVTYIGIKGGEVQLTPGVKSTSPGVKSTSPGVKSTSPQVGNTLHPKSEVDFTHKKEKKEKKEIKKGMTNFDRLVELLPEDYKTQERIDYIKNKYEDRINSIDSIDSAIESWVINIKIELNKVFPMEYKIHMKKEEVSDTIDLL